MIKTPIIVLVIKALSISLIASVSHAACESDRTGIVYCSRYAGGDAVLGPDGTVVCGKGECLRGKFGRFECSKVAGGGAGRDRRGIVRCLGGCAEASEDLCVAGE